jgi:hypothetical protein
MLMLYPEASMHRLECVTMEPKSRNRPARVPSKEKNDMWAVPPVMLHYVKQKALNLLQPATMCDLQGPRERCLAFGLV